MDSEASKHYNLESSLQDRSAKPCAIPFQYLKSITDDFSDGREVGRGGFGVVYKGVQQNGEMIAVKKLQLPWGVQDKQFNNEADNLMWLKHQNIVRFIGYCYEMHGKYEEYNGKYVFVESPKRMLCFEFLPNGSLEKYIFDESSGLDWHKRYRIIEGICRGLHYLHEEWKTNTPIIHLDLKPANILLDDNMVPKITDFGLSRLFGEQQTRTCTTNLKGSFGYMAPEYLHKGIITTKSDIFSLGVIIIEVMTGHRDYPDDFETSSQDFVKLVLKNWRRRLEGAPKYMSLEIDCQQIKTCIEIGLKCVEKNREKRPTTREIIQILNRWQNMNLHGSNDEKSLGNQKTKTSDQPQLRAHQEKEDLLVVCISQDLGFSNGRSIAACLIYRCLLHWGSFEAERTSVFDRIIQTTGTAIESKEDNDSLSYWLSNSSALLFLVRRRTQKTTSPQVGFFWRAFGYKELQAPPQSAPKYPALLFQQQLTAYVEKMFGMIRDNLKKDISPVLGLCIQAPRTTRASLIKGSRARAIDVAKHWQSIVETFTTYFNILKSNYVDPFLIRKLFTQIFLFVNVQLFNSLLLRRECCSYSNGEYVNNGLALLEQWCINATEEYSGSSWDELKHLRQAIGFLVLRGKPPLTLEELTNELCPVLSIQQLYRISTMYWDDKGTTHSVSAEVIANMRTRMVEDSDNAVTSSFLLDDDSSIPFTGDDIDKEMIKVEVTDVEIPHSIHENPDFSFLHDRKE